MSARPSQTPAEEFLALLRQTPVVPTRVASFLDALTPAQRIAAVRAAGRREQRRLYAAVDGFAPLALVDLVPESVPDGATVRHHGRNTLPAFSHFEKRFSRPPGADPRKPDALCGYNHQRFTPALIGPGYFVAREDSARPEVLVDYRELPPRAPEGWPAVRSNESGLARLVFGFMVDRLRRVSEHVTIGSAARNGRDLGSWFLLAREDPS